MTNTALVIQDIQSQSFDDNAFTSARNLVTEYCYTGTDALSAIKSARYRCVIVSMDMAREDPVEIIGALREAESELGLTPNQILVTGRTLQLTQLEMTKLNISAQIRSHHLK
jgi:ActR/RegA family two-component response regulator